MKTTEWTWKSKDGLEMYARAWEPKAAPKAVVCLVHGMGEHVGRYEHVGQTMAKAGYVLAGFDLRGHGHSGGPRGHTPSKDAFFEDIDLFLMQIAKRYPDRPRILYGHSLGGILVLAYAPQHGRELAGVIATAPAMESAIEQQKVKKALAIVLGSLIPGLAIPSGLVPSTLSHDPKVVRDYINDPLVHDRITTGLGKIMMDVIKTVYEQAPRFPVPVLVMHGELDALGFPSGSRRFASLVPKNCTLKIWDGMFHEIHNEPDQAEVLQFMLRWMDRQLRRG